MVFAVFLCSRHPNTLGGLSSSCLVHDIELGSEQMVKERRLSGRLRTKNGDDMVAEAGSEKILNLEVYWEVLAVIWRSVVEHGQGARSYVRKVLVLVNDLNSVRVLLQVLRSGILEPSESSIHLDARSSPVAVGSHGGSGGGHCRGCGARRNARVGRRGRRPATLLANRGGGCNAL